MPSPTRMTAQSRREQIQAIAARRFAETGLHGTSAETIARELGISQAYVFALFGTKKALFSQVVVAAFDRMTALMVEAAGDMSGPETLMRMGAEYRSRLADRDGLLLMMQGFAACGDLEVREAVRGAFGRLWATVTELSGLDPLRVKTFIAYGMLLNDLAAIDVDAVDAAWARDSRTPIPIEVYR